MIFGKDTGARLLSPDARTGSHGRHHPGAARHLTARHSTSGPLYCGVWRLSAVPMQLRAALDWAKIKAPAGAGAGPPQGGSLGMLADSSLNARAAVLFRRRHSFPEQKKPRRRSLAPGSRDARRAGANVHHRTGGRGGRRTQGHNA